MFHFVANLKPYTIGDEGRAARFDGYLISVDYATKEDALVKEVHRQRRLLVADNGNFDRMGQLLKAHTAEAARLAKARQTEEKKLGRSSRPGELSAGLRAKYAALMRKLAATARVARGSDDVAEVVASQSRLAPAYLIGMEDFTIPLALGLGIERAYGPTPMSFYTQAARRAIDYALQTRAGRFGSCEALVFAGLHATDFDSAKAIGKLAGKARLDGIAVGFGTALDDRGYCDYRIEDGRILPFASTTPRPYVRIADIATGMHLGYAEGAGHRPRFHALGIGTPILLPLLAVLGNKGTYTATDSTAPIKDAYSSVTIAMYVDRPAPLKLKAYLIVEKWLDGGIAWECSCPYCSAFLRQHPFRLQKAKRWWVAEGRRALAAADLWSPSPLAEFMPLLAMPKDAALRRAAGMARIGHNHFITHRIETALRRRSGTALRDYVDGIVEKYLAAGSAPAWKAATRAAWDITRRGSIALVGSGGEF